MGDEMIVAIHQPHYMPWLGYLWKIKHSDVFVISDDLQYTKDSFINRNRIVVNNKPHWLTIPILIKGKSGQLIKDVRINWDRDWNRKHFYMIRYNYPNIDREKIEVLEKFFNYDLNDMLFNWCMRSMEFLCTEFGINTKFYFASELGITGTKTERLYNICKVLNADTYLSGQGGKNYMDESMFQDIKIEYRRWQPKSILSALHFYLKDETRIFSNI